MKKGVIEISKPREIERAIAKPLKLKKSDKKLSIGIPFSVVGAILPTFAGAVYVQGLTVSQILEFYTVFAPGLLSFAGLMSTGFLLSARRSRIAEEIFGTADQATVYAIGKNMRKAGKGKTFVNSFHVKTAGEVDISTWQDPKINVPQNESSHTINQYLVKEKGTYRVEQEVIPNEETIWDLSADALVEVYGIEEPLSRKEIAEAK
jgi:hypothetical protein